MSRKKTNGWRIALIVVASLVIAVVVAAVIGWNYASKRYEGEPVTLYVDPRGGQEALRDSLQARLGEEYGARVYKIWGYMSTADELRPGRYEIASGAKAYEIARRIKQNRQDPVSVTFNNIRLLPQLAARIDAKLYISDVDFLNATDSILRLQGVEPENYIAHFLPDKYEFYWSDSPEKVVKKLTAAYDRFWTEERLQKAKAEGLTPEQVAVVASIVEEESNKADEHGKIARLYLNRIHRGMKLQADPTVKYAVGDFGIRRITSAHLNTPSPYNTYLNAGLPPGPIRMPEAATLKAVLDAPSHNYIYMCAKEDLSGRHNFATDYSTHQANARRYQAELNRRGIK